MNNAKPAATGTVKQRKIVIRNPHGLHARPAAQLCKLAATFLFVLAVVSTPRESFWAYGCYVVVMAAVASLAQVPILHVLHHLAIELPFAA